MAHQDFQPQKTLKWLFFDLNSFFASVEQQDRPDLCGKPVAIVPSATDATCAIAASYEAKAYGITTGTKIYEAKKLCPSLICVLARHDVYVDYHRRIFEEVERHIPIVQKCSIDEAACSLTKNEQTPDRAIAIAESIKQGLRNNIGPVLSCSIGIAQNIFLAKVAAGMQKPDGLVVLPPNAYKDQLFRLALSDLPGVGINMERRLRRAGITAIEQIWHLQPKHARQIWGTVAGEIFWYRLHGYDIPNKPVRKNTVGHSRILDPSHRNSEQAYPIVRHLALKACARLRRYGLYARKLTLTVRTQEIPNQGRACWSKEISFAASQDDFTILRVLHGLWRQMQIDAHRKQILKVSVTLHDLYEPQEMTLDLFESVEQTSRQARSDRLSQAIDVLNKRYGAQTVTIGTYPNTAAGYMGTKIAFSRVPEPAEFSSPSALGYPIK